MVVAGALKEIKVREVIVPAQGPFSKGLDGLHRIFCYKAYIGPFKVVRPTYGPFKGFTMAL